MDLNSILFPAPKSSYTIGRVHGELIWIPKKSAENEDDAQRLHTAPDLRSSSPTTLSYKTDLLKIKKMITITNPMLKPISKPLLKPIPKDPGIEDISIPTTASSNMLFLEETAQSVERTNLQSFGNKATLWKKDESLKKREFFKLKKKNMLTQSKGDEDNDWMDDKYPCIEEEFSLKLVTEYYSKVPKASDINKKSNNQKLLASDSKTASVFNKPGKKMPACDQNSQQSCNASQNNNDSNVQKLLSAKNLRVIENNLSTKINETQNFKQKESRLKPRLPKFDYDENEISTYRMDIDNSWVDEIKKSGSNQNDENVKENPIDFENIETKRTDKDSFVDKLEEFSNPPTVRKCYQQRYINPRAITEMSSLVKNTVTPCPRKRFEMRIPNHSEKPNMQVKTSILTKQPCSSLNRIMTPTLSLQRSNRSMVSKNEYIPCMLLRSGFSSNKLMIYFHGNGEDINSAFDLLSHIRNYLRIHVIAIEYPGYGIYKGKPNELTILEDSERVYDYLVTQIKVDPCEIIVFGRSIGSGPASHLASKKNIGALVLMSPFTSIRSVVKDLAGSWAKFLIKERFDNLKSISKVTCPTFFIHGQCDNLIPFHHSKLLHDACKAPSELLLPKKMNHIEFDFFNDFTFPLIKFLGKCGLKFEKPEATRINFPRKIFEAPDYMTPQIKKNQRSISPNAKYVF